MFMHNNDSNETKRPVGAERPFPWRCRHCGKDQVFMTTLCYDAEVRHKGRLYSFTLPSLAIPVCRNCGEKVFTESVDSQIDAALRVHVDLLPPGPTSAAPQGVPVT